MLRGLLYALIVFLAGSMAPSLREVSRARPSLGGPIVNRVYFVSGRDAIYPGLKRSYLVAIAKRAEAEYRSDLLLRYYRNVTMITGQNQ
jgi:hypothetical protein